MAGPGALVDQLKGLTMAGRGIESRVPLAAMRDVAAHDEGGCYALAFDRPDSFSRFIFE